MNTDIRPKSTGHHSFNALALSYVASHSSSLSDDQLQRRLDHLGAHLLVFFGTFDLSDISPVKLQKFIYHLEAQGLKSKDIQACLVTFRVCVRHAIWLQWNVNPALLHPVCDDGFTPEPPQLSEQEFSNLYQDLLQDMTTNMFH